MIRPTWLLSKWWFYVSIAAAFCIGIAVPLLFGTIGALVLGIVCSTSAFFLGRKAARILRRERQVQDWQDSHPGMTDHWLPKHLK